MRFPAVLFCVLVTTAMAPPVPVEKGEENIVEANGEHGPETPVAMADPKNVKHDPVELMKKKKKTGTTILLSMGALRYNFMMNYMPDTYYYFQRRAKAQEMKPVVPTKGTVNHYSIATGLYPEDHGVINDCIYDEPKGKCEYGKHNDKIKPIWIENQIEGGISAVMNWPGSKDKYSGKKAKIILPYEENDDCLTQNKERIKNIFKALDQDNANLVMVYNDEIDKMLHSYTDRDLHEKYKCADLFVGSLIQQLESDYKNVNLILLGSHASFYYNHKNGKIDLNTILIGECECPFVAMGANAIVTPKNDEQLQKVLATLDVNANNGKKTLYRVYHKNIPDHWHINKMPLFANNIYLVANIEFYFWNEYLEGTINDPNSIHFLANVDGYIEENGGINSTIFMALGPRINLGTKVPAFDTIDVYALLRELLVLPEKENTKICDAMNLLLKPIEDVIYFQKPVPEPTPVSVQATTLGKKMSKQLNHISKPMGSVLLGGAKFIGGTAMVVPAIIYTATLVLRTSSPK